MLCTTGSQEVSGLSQFSWEPQRGEQSLITECLKAIPSVHKSKGQGLSLALHSPHQGNQDAEDSL